MSAEEQAPKVFISYSWTTPEHEDRVLQIATELRRSGVDAILDKWELKGGGDVNAFMEKMVTDPSIKKVIMICDGEYVRKANLREGGVGSEAQMITAKIYKKQQQNKFVAVVLERDKSQSYCVPNFYGSRMFIDATDTSEHNNTLDKILRWIFENPSHKKPEIGSVPDFLKTDQEGISTAMSHQVGQTLDAIRKQQSNALSLVRDYFENLLREMEKFRIDPKNSGEIDDLVIENIESFLPHQNAVIQIYSSLARNECREDVSRIIHHFLEKAIPYMLRFANNPHREWDNDNFRFIAHELFLYAVVCFLREEQFDTVGHLLKQRYYLPPDIESYGSNMENFSLFSTHLSSLDYRKERLKSNQTSLHSDLLMRRVEGFGIESRHLMQADLVLFLRSHLDNQIKSSYRTWFPLTLLYASDGQPPFEVFARSCSKEYFNKMKVVLGIKEKTTLGNFLQDKAWMVPQFAHNVHYQTLRFKVLCGYEKIATIS